jgi:hypothetical protein
MFSPNLRLVILSSAVESADIIAYIIYYALSPFCKGHHSIIKPVEYIFQTLKFKKWMFLIRKNYLVIICFKIQMEEIIDQQYIKEFEDLEKEYNNFYNEDIKQIKIIYLYINNDNEVYSIKSENEKIENSCLTSERILYLIKNNQTNLLTKHKLVSLLKFNIDLEHTELKNFILNESTNNYLISLKIIDTIQFNNSIDIFNDLNSVIFIFTNKIEHKNNTTKRINIRTNTSKTRRNKERPPQIYQVSS